MHVAVVDYAPVTDRGRLRPSQTRTALDRRSTAPTGTRPATAATCSEANTALTYLLAYLLTYSRSYLAAQSDADELIAEMEFGAEIACKSVYVAALINYSATSNSARSGLHWVGETTTK